MNEGNVNQSSYDREQRDVSIRAPPHDEEMGNREDGDSIVVETQNNLNTPCVPPTLPNGRDNMDDINIQPLPQQGNFSAPFQPPINTAPFMDEVHDYDDLEEVNIGQSEEEEEEEMTKEKKNDEDNNKRPNNRLVSFMTQMQVFAELQNLPFLDFTDPPVPPVNENDQIQFFFDNGNLPAPNQATRYIMNEESEDEDEDAVIESRERNEGINLIFDEDQNTIDLLNQASDSDNEEVDGENIFNNNYEEQGGCINTTSDISNKEEEEEEEDVIEFTVADPKTLIQHHEEENIVSIDDDMLARIQSDDESRISKFVEDLIMKDIEAKETIELVSMEQSSRESVMVKNTISFFWKLILFFFRFFLKICFWLFKESEELLELPEITKMEIAKPEGSVLLGLLEIGSSMMKNSMELYLCVIDLFHSYSSQDETIGDMFVIHPGEETSGSLEYIKIYSLSSENPENSFSKGYNATSLKIFNDFDISREIVQGLPGD